jgi:DNA replicative helicase MCM subunit Mcm2 (Cdc46/Mcm family)
VFAHVSSEDWIGIIDDLPAEIQDMPIAIKWRSYPQLSPRLLASLVSTATTSTAPNVASIEEKFAALANRWHDETDFLSSPSRITSNDSYLQIISMGRRVIPMILEDLKERGGHWYPALRILSGEDPVPIEARGDVEQMKKSWLQWGRERGYIE